jgi:DNA-binding response OmpR family regulator
MTRVQALIISADPALRRQLAVAIRSAERRTGERWEPLEAENGLEGIDLAWRMLPDVVVADEIASGAGAFAVAKDLRGAAVPFPGAVIVILARPQDDWLARWSGADAWMTKPIDPFALSDVVMELVERRTVRKERV